MHMMLMLMMMMMLMTAGFVLRVRINQAWPICQICVFNQLPPTGNTLQCNEIQCTSEQDTGIQYNLMKGISFTARGVRNVKQCIIG